MPHHPPHGPLHHWRRRWMAPRPAHRSWGRPHRHAVRIGQHVGHFVKNLCGRISQVARGLVGTSNSRYYRADPYLACASFVSTVLVEVGAIPVRDFTRSASALRPICRQHGARLVLPPGTPLSPAAVQAVQAGDIILFSRGRNHIHHAGIGIGHGRFVGTSSRGRVVREWDLAKWRRIYGHIQTYRFPSGTRLTLYPVDGATVVAAAPVPAPEKVD